MTLRLPQKDLKFIDSFLEKNDEFKNRSELLRVSASELIERRLALQKGAAQETFVPVSDDQIDAIDYLIRLGRFKSREAALFEILRNFLDSVEWEKVEDGRKKLQDIKYQVGSARDLDRKIEEEYLKD
jgi:Arc/MetJ-type ribon-helix-helix transcriptional regulator